LRGAALVFVTDQLIYIQMQKTGSSHIVSLLSGLFDGEQVGNHNAASAAQIASDLYFISSIRNPWDWYLSLWTFGVQGGGGLKEILTTRMYRRAFNLLLKEPRQGVVTLRHEAFKDVRTWRDVYDDSGNVSSFRKWLKLVHDPQHANRLGEGYGNSAITGICGFMTYRYLYLCCADPWRLNDPGTMRSFLDIWRFEQDASYIDYTIRQEALEEDFISAVDAVRPLSPEEKAKILGARKINTSQRSRTVGDYYDEETIEIVARREKLLIDKFGYQPPVNGSS
jgi:hypothetical protein